MRTSAVIYNLKLETTAWKDGSAWLAWCLPLDVMTQASTKRAALKSLKEAVHLWIESCLDRGVLDEALREAGFRRAEAGPRIGHRADSPRPARGNAHPSAFSPPEFIEVSVPAYTAAHRLEPRASR
jgi:predicted RNase H-like HicB family nuclease